MIMKAKHLFVLGLLVFALAACSNTSSTIPNDNTGVSTPSGPISSDSSSTPISSDSSSSPVSSDSSDSSSSSSSPTGPIDEPPEYDIGDIVDDDDVDYGYLV